MITKNLYQKVSVLASYMACAKLIKKDLGKCPPLGPILSEIKTHSDNLAKLLVPLIKPIKKLTIKIVLHSLMKYVSKIQNTIWSVLTLSPFSPVHNWMKLLKSYVIHFIRLKNFFLTSIKTSLRNFSELHFATMIFCLVLLVN